MKVAILTPRAGTYNHRWIVASKEIPELERRLSDWLEKLKADSPENPDKEHGILLNVRIVQESSGRVGEEFFFLYDEKFHQLGNSTRFECLNLLKAWRSRNIDRVVQNVGASKECEVSLICENEEVKNLEKELDRIVPESHRGLAKRSHYGGMVFSMIAVLIIVATGFCGCCMNLDWLQSRKNTRENENHSVENTKKQLSREDEQLWAELQQQWNQNFLFREGNPLPLEEITQKQLVSIYEKNIGGTSWNSCTPPQQVGTLRVLSSSGIREEDKPQWDILQGVDPVQFRICVREYQKTYDQGALKLWNDADENIQLDFFVNRSPNPDWELMEKMQTSWNKEVLELAKKHIFEPLVSNEIGPNHQEKVRAQFKTDAPDAMKEIARFVRFSNEGPELLDRSVKNGKIEFDPPTAPLSRRAVIDYLAKLPDEACPAWVIEFSKLLDSRE